MVKEHSAKVGTIPTIIIVRGRLCKRVGAWITFRRASPGTAWERGIIDRVNEDGYMFICRM